MIQNTFAWSISDAALRARNLGPWWSSHHEDDDPRFYFHSPDTFFHPASFSGFSLSDPTGSAQWLRQEALQVSSAPSVTANIVGSDFVTEGPIWPSHTISWWATNPPAFMYIFQIGNGIDVSSTVQNAIFQNDIASAFARWASVANLNFVHASSASEADILLSWAEIDGAGHTTPNGFVDTLGRTTFSGNTYFDRPVRISFDEQLDDSKIWQPIGGEEYTDGVSFYSVALHEIGHALGLGHYDGGAAVMNTNAGVVDLTASDIHGIQFLYGAATGQQAGSISISDAEVVEGNSGVKQLTFTVTRVGGAAAFDVSFNTSSWTALSFENDYQPTFGTLHFAANENVKTIPVTINGDLNPEANEIFFVGLSGATNGATISDGEAIGTIINDDEAKPDLDVLNTMTLSNQSILIGGSTTVKYTLANNGSSQAGPSRVGFYYSRDTVFDASDIFLTERSFGPINAHAQVDDSFALSLVIFDTFYVIAVADYNNQVAGEGSESNNPSNAVLISVSETETTRNSDGSYSVHRVDAFNQYSFKDYFLFFDGQDRLLSQTTNNDDGTHFLFGWDARNQFAWSDYRVVTDSLNRATSQTTNNDDGTHILQGWDVLNQQSWSDYRVLTDSLNRATSQVTNNDNGTRLVDAWDVANQFDWSSYRVTYDGLNRPLNQVTSNDNGSRIVFQWDVGNQADWADYRITYDSLNRPLSQVTNNDNGSRIVYAWDVQNQTSWSDYRVTYDSLGRAVSQVTNNDNGTHLIYGWDVQNQASWSDYAVTTDSQNRATSQTTNFDNGTHSVTAWDVQNQFNWAYKTDYFDAQWRHLSQQGVYDNGTTWMA
jgi:YD repeat-containing protein